MLRIRSLQGLRSLKRYKAPAFAFASVMLVCVWQYENIRDVFVKLVASNTALEDKMISKHAEQLAAFESENNQLERCDFLLIGDSHTRGLPARALPANLLVVNRALNGETTTGVLQRFDKSIATIDATKVVVLVGYNDLKYRSVDAAIVNYQKILTQLKGDQIFVISLFPVSHKRTIVNEQIIAFNEALKQLSKSSAKYKYVDVYSKLYDPRLKGITPAYTSDGTHLSDAGYKVLVEALRLLMNSPAYTARTTPPPALSAHRP